MAIDDELKAQILRYHFVEHWRVGTMASQLGVHHSTVERVLGEAGVERERQRPRRPSKLDSYMAFITETLERFPTLSAARLFDMVTARGYTGGPDHFRHRIAQLLPAPVPRSVSAPSHPCGRAGSGRLGTLRKAHHRTRRTPPDGVRHGAELLAPTPSCASTSAPRSPTSSAATSRRSPCWGARRGPAVRQHEKRRARTPRRRHPIPSHTARARRPLPLRATPRRTGQRK